MKLRAKFTFLFIGLVVSMGLVIAFITFNWQRKAIEEQMRARATGICRTLAVTAAEAMLAYDFTELRQYIDEIKKDITELKVGQAVIVEKLKAITSKRWTPRQKVAIVVAVISGVFLLAGNIVLAFGK